MAVRRELRARPSPKRGPARRPSPAETDSAEARPKPALKALADRLPLWRRPGYLVRRLHQVHYALFFEECAAFGITPVQYGLLTILSTNPDADQVTLANALGIDRTNVADVLRRLEQGGLVKPEAERRRPPHGAGAADGGG